MEKEEMELVKVFHAVKLIKDPLKLGSNIDEVIDSLNCKSVEVTFLYGKPGINYYIDSEISLFEININPSFMNDPNISFCIRFLELLAKKINPVHLIVLPGPRDTDSFIEIVSNIIYIANITVILLLDKQVDTMSMLIEKIKSKIAGLEGMHKEVEKLVQMDRIYCGEIRYLELLDSGNPVEILRRLYNLDTLIISGKLNDEVFRETVNTLSTMHVDSISFYGVGRASDLVNLPYLEYLCCPYSLEIFRAIYKKVIKYRPFVWDNFDGFDDEMVSLLNDPQCMIDEVLEFDNYFDEAMETMNRRKIIHQRIKDMHLSRGIRTMLYGFMYGGRGSLMFIHSISPTLANLIVGYL
jgi:hypothetical protein